jgi:hypothetical protein
MSSNTAFACSKKESKKDLTTSHQNKALKSVQSNCCNNETKGIGHDCNKKCKDHHCECSTLSSFSFLNKSFNTDLIIVNYTSQKCFSLYKPSFYNDVYISIWHPPKIV